MPDYKSNQAWKSRGLRVGSLRYPVGPVDHLSPSLVHMAAYFLGYNMLCKRSLKHCNSIPHPPTHLFNLTSSTNPNPQIQRPLPLLTIYSATPRPLPRLLKINMAAHRLSPHNLQNMESPRTTTLCPKDHPTSILILRPDLKLVSKCNNQTLIASNKQIT